MTGSVLSVLVWVDTRGGDPLPFVDDELNALAAVPELELHVERETPWGGLGHALLRHRPDVFHFIGHGSSRGNLLAWDGATGGARERTPEEIRTRLSAAPSGGPRGLFFNACHSARWAPTLIPPAGGWVAGTNVAIDDEVAGMFAPAFYRHLVVAGTSAEDAHRMATAELVDEGFDRDELQHSVWLEKSLLPNPGDTARGIAHLLRTVFTRSAFRDPMVRELSFHDLDQALEDVLCTLGTGQLFTRADRSHPFMTVDARLLDDPQVMALVRKAGQRVQDARLRLRRLQGAFPYVGDMITGFGWGMDQSEQARLLQMLDAVDDSRNAVLKAVNAYLKQYGLPAFALIRRSSTLLPPSARP